MSRCNAWVGTKTKQTMPSCSSLSSVKLWSIFDGAFTQRTTPQCCVCPKTFPQLKLAHTFMINVDIRPTDRLRTTRGRIWPKTTFDLFFWPQADITCPGFQEYHERLQTFLMWFIETASFIDSDDDRWDFFLVWVPSWFDITPSAQHTHTHTKAFIVSLKNKGPFCGACDQLPGQFDYISLVGELLIRQELPLCQKPFSDFPGPSAELNTVVFWNGEQCGNSKKSLCRCFLYPGNY